MTMVNVMRGKHRRRISHRRVDNHHHHHQADTWCPKTDRDGNLTNRGMGSSTTRRQLQSSRRHIASHVDAEPATRRSPPRSGGWHGPHCGAEAEAGTRGSTGRASPPAALIDGEGKSPTKA
ncbi:hypothetical protein SEVIR_9G536901v4 [Setaria viridis]